MKRVSTALLKPPSTHLINHVLCFLRIGIGILTIAHGAPKIVGGITMWTIVGAAMNYIGIHFWTSFWGLLAACTEFFGGMLLVIGFGTRFISFLLSIMMSVAFIMHVQKGDPFTKYSFPLTMLIIFVSFILLGSGEYSLDSYLYKRYIQR